MSKKFFSEKWILLIGILFLTRCKDPYDPPIKGSANHYLVVEGFINPDGQTNIKLSRTRNITAGDTASDINELNANVVIEDNSNNMYPLADSGKGNYSGIYNLSTSNQYRLHITTSDNKEYLSKFVSCKISPPIDNVGWNLNSDNGVQVFVNTHDPNNNTRYYRWSYTETWEFHSQYYSLFTYVPSDSTVIVRTAPVYVCYQTDNSSTIILGSSAKLAQDIIHEAPVIAIPVHDKKISVLYSILVTQYPLDSAGYNYWNAMKSNTENVGSIFDSQPNQTVGNIKCTTDSSELVIGYIGAGTTDQSRLFINNSSMPFGWNQPPNCTEYDVPTDSIVYYFGSGSFIPIQITNTGYFSASSSCVDCTLSGSPIKPSFWP
ncbi:MAG TPA: DUF4249 domain-containing protein [Hanamia sp.]